MYRVKRLNDKKYNCIIYDGAEHELFEHHYDESGYICNDELLLKATSKEEFKMKLAVLNISEDEIHFMHIQDCSGEKESLSI